MNLYINLLLDSERRSTRRVSHKFIIKLSALLLMLLFLLFIFIVVNGARSTQKSLLFAEQEKKQLENTFRLVTELCQELAGLQELTNAISVWAQTRPDWPLLLSNLPAFVPANIQLTRLTMNESITAVNNVPMRIVTLYLQGKAAGEHSEIDVQGLEKSLREQPPFGEVMESAQVKQFEAVRNEGQENMRVFDIECRLKARKLFQPAKPPPPEKAKKQ